MPKKLIFILIAVALVAAGLGAVYYFQVKKVAAPGSQTSQTLNFSLNPSSTVVKQGNKVTLSVYITGQNADKVSAFDVRLNYDKNKLNLVSATPGGFFGKYIEIKWDKNMAWFAQSVNPSEQNTTTPDPTLPAVVLDFTATDKGNVDISVDEKSAVYVSNVGGFYPTGKVSLTVN